MGSQRIIELIKSELKEHENNLEKYRGGIAEYVKNLEDSDTFYNKASTLGAIFAIGSIMEKIIKK